MKNYAPWVNSADTSGADLRHFVKAWAKDSDKPKQAKDLQELAELLGLFDECFRSPTRRG